MVERVEAGQSIPYTTLKLFISALSKEEVRSSRRTGVVGDRAAVL